MSALRFVAAVLTSLHLAVVCSVTVKKCCPPNHYYVPQYDRCINSTSAITSKLIDIDESFVQFSSFINVTFTEKLAACPPGQTAKVTVKIRLLADGSIKGTDADKETFQPSEFCLAEGDPKLEVHKWFLRFCVPDPCAEGNACIRKCCPRGFVYVLPGENSSAAHGCIPFEGIPFTPPIWSQQQDRDVRIAVKEAAGPVCQKFVLDPALSEWDQFAVIPDSGNLRYCPTPHVEYLQEYCVDHFMDAGDTSSLSMKAVICYVKPSDQDSLFLKIYPYAMFATSFFTFATVLVYLMVPKLRNWHGKNVICHVVSMTVTYILLGVVQVDNGYVWEGILCKTIAVTIHFSFISCFTWLNVLSFSICRALTKLQPKGMVNNSQSQQKRRFIFYSIYGWGVPFIIVAVGQIVELFAGPCSGLISPRFGTLKCWFADDKGLVYYLYGPIGCMIVTNILLFCITAVAYWKACNAGQLAARSARTTQRFRVVLGLSLLMGVTWVLEVLSFVTGGSSHSWIVPDLFNILTGVFIFFMFVCKPEVGRLLQESWKKVMASLSGGEDSNGSAHALRERSNRETRE